MTSYEILVARTKFLVALATRKAQFRTLVQWWIQGACPPPPPSPLFLNQIEGQRAEKKFLGDRAPPYLRVWMTTCPPYLKVWIRHCSNLLENGLLTFYL